MRNRGQTQRTVVNVLYERDAHTGNELYGNGNYTLKLGTKTLLALYQIVLKLDHDVIQDGRQKVVL